MTVYKRNDRGGFDAQPPVVPPLPEIHQSDARGEIAALRARLDAVEGELTLLRRTQPDDERLSILEANQRDLSDELLKLVRAQEPPAA